MAKEYTKEFDKEIKTKTYDGLISLEEFKNAFNLALNSEDKIRSWFDGMTKDELLKEVHSYRNYKSEKKEKIIEFLVDDVITFYALGSYSHVFGSANKHQGIINKVNSLTQKSLSDYAEEVKRQREDYKKRLEHYKKSISNPETKEEFLTFIEYKGKDAMTAEQRAKYDEIVGETTKEKQKADILNKAIVKKVDLPESVSLNITQTKHTKTGEDLFVVKLSERVDKDTYKELNSKAKKLGGWYSSYTKDGAIAGFQFKEKEQAEKFISIKESDVSNIEKVEERQEEKSEKRADSLRKNAEGIIEKVDAELSRERQTNTARRARMANSAEDKLRYEKSIALTMIKIANAIDSGETKYLDLIRTKAQVEQLKSILSTAKRSYILKTYPNEPYERHSGMETIEDMVDFIHKSHYFFPELYKKHYIDAINKFSDRSGLKLISERVKKIINRSNDEDYFQIRDKYEMAKIVEFASKIPDTLETNRVKENLKEHKRLASMGIESNEMQRALLREFVKFVSGTTVKADKVKELERKLAGRKGIGFDFFPTPKNVCVKMVELANINSLSMSVLEPSAGNGNIADAVKEQTGIICDVCEISSELSEILKEKGYNIVSSDFLGYSEKKYDRILMNPPFSNRMDAEHIIHAYDLLNPSGRIVAIVGEGVFFGTDAKAKNFQNWLEERNADVEKLETNTFMDKSLYANTGASARLIVIDKPFDEKEKQPKPIEEESPKTSHQKQLENIEKIEQGGNYIIYAKTKDIPKFMPLKNIKTGEVTDRLVYATLVPASKLESAKQYIDQKAYENKQTELVLQIREAGKSTVVYTSNPENVQLDEKPIVTEENQLQGGKADDMTLEQIAEKHGKDLDWMKEQFEKGLKVESEHTSDIEKQSEIVLDHLSEYANYYIELKKMENKLEDDDNQKQLELENENEIELLKIELELEKYSDGGEIKKRVKEKLKKFIDNVNFKDKKTFIFIDKYSFGKENEIKLKLSIDKYDFEDLKHRNDKTLGKDLSLQIFLNNSSYYYNFVYIELKNFKIDDPEQVLIDLFDKIINVSEKINKKWFSISEISSKIINYFKEKNIWYKFKDTKFGSQYIESDAFGLIRISNHDAKPTAYKNFQGYEYPNLEFIEGYYSGDEIINTFKNIESKK
jgi:hypothetical protein